MASSTKYVRKRTRIEVSRSSDYSNLLHDEEYTQETTATQYKVQEVLVSTLGTSLELGEFTTVDDVIIHNRDATNRFDLDYRNAPGAASTMHTRVAAGCTVHLGPITVANDLTLTANGANCEAVVEIYGTI